MERREFLKLSVIAGLGFMGSGCCLAGFLERILRHAVTGSPRGTWSGSRFFAPQAGLLIMENPNPAVWAETFLLEGHFSERNVFTFDPYDPKRIVFVTKPIAYWRISAPISRGGRNSVPDLRSFAQKVLPPCHAGYTLVVFHRNIWWQMVGRGPEVIRFQIHVRPFRDGFKFNGRWVGCDEYIRFGRRNASEKTYLRLNLKIALRDYIPW